MLGSFVSKVFEVRLTRFQMIRSRCTVQWTSENLCHRWHGWRPYQEMPRVIGGLLGSRWARQESSGAGQRPGC